ncbi:hypothetical protein ACS0TY_009702 [Phlomoides rotata]
MLLTARIAGFLLLFGLVTIAFSLQGRDNRVERNLVVSERKAKQTTIGNVNLGRKMVSDYNVTKKETKKEIGDIYTRKTRMLKTRENYEGRFVAFNADYKGPRHHPPKNN